MRFLLTLLLLALPALAEKKLSADELKEVLAKEKVVFLDVRPLSEIEEMGTIKGYVNIPLAELESRLSELPKDRPIITACRRGTRAARAAEILERNGYKVAGSCGLTEWKEKGYEVVYPKK